jgi:hypothetical protein
VPGSAGEADGAGKKKKGPVITQVLKDRVLSAIKAGCVELRDDGITMTEVNAYAKAGYDRSFYATKELIEDGLVSMQKIRIDGTGTPVKVYRGKAR